MRSVQPLLSLLLVVPLVGCPPPKESAPRAGPAPDVVAGQAGQAVSPPLEVQRMRVCVVEGATLREVEAMYDPATGDTLVAGQAMATAYPASAGYAAGATWYINNEPIIVNGRRYVRFGLPRVVGVTEVARAGEYQGVGVFTEASATGTPDVVYVPVRPGCEFQPYQLEVAISREVEAPPSVVFRMFPAGTYFMLEQPLTYRIGTTSARITVPAGFVTDLASIPPAFQGIFSLTGPYSIPAIIHDYLYWDQGCTKDEADQIFLWAMMESRVPPFERTGVYSGVRTPGVSDAAYRRNATDRVQRLPRIIPPQYRQLPPLAAWPTYRSGLKNLNVQLDPGRAVPQSVCTWGRSSNPPPGVQG